MIEVVTKDASESNNAIHIESNELYEQPKRKHRSPFQLAIRRFLKNKLAIVGMIVLLIIVAAAVCCTTSD